MQGCEDSYMYIYCIFPPPVIGMLATYLLSNGLISQLLGECWRAISIVIQIEKLCLSVGDGY